MSCPAAQEPTLVPIAQPGRYIWSSLEFLPSVGLTNFDPGYFQRGYSVPRSRITFSRKPLIDTHFSYHPVCA